MKVGLKVESVVYILCIPAAQPQVIQLRYQLLKCVQFVPLKKQKNDNHCY